MTIKHQIILSYTKDLSVETPDAESLLSARENISKYSLNFDLNSKFLKNKMIEVETKLTYEDKTKNKKKTYFEMIYATIVKIEEENPNKEDIKKFILQSQTKNLKTSYYPKDFSDFDVKFSFGMGTPAKISWISVHNQEIRSTKGINCVYLYYKEQNMLVLAYGIMENFVDDDTWPNEIKENNKTINKSSGAPGGLKYEISNREGFWVAGIEVKETHNHVLWE